MISIIQTLMDNCLEFLEYWVLVWPQSSENQGIISMVSLIITVIALWVAWRSFVVPLKKERNTQKETQLFMQYALLHEIWCNMNLAYGIEKSYRNNIKNQGATLHTPKYTPRTIVLEKFTMSEYLSSWKTTNEKKMILLEVLGQTHSLIYEYEKWQELVLKHNGFVKDLALYQTFSETMIELIDTVMRNSLTLFLPLLMGKDVIKQVDKKPLHDLQQEIKKLFANGKKIYSTYKSSYVKNGLYKPDLNEIDVIICWEDDWEECEIEVIELKDRLALHETWKDN